MQVWCDWQVTLCDPHLSALDVRFSRRCVIQIDVYLYRPSIVANANCSMHHAWRPDNQIACGRLQTCRNV